MWLLFATLSGLFYTGEGLIQRFLMRQKKDAWAFSFYYSFIGAIVSLPFMLASPQVPHTLGPWLLVVLVGLLIVVHNLLIFKASQYLSPTVSGSLSKLRLAWVFILGIVVLGETFSWAQLGGTVLTMLAGVLIIHRFRKPESATGVALLLGSTVAGAFLIILSKYLLDSFNPASFTFFASFLPAAIFNFMFMPHAYSRVRKLIRTDWRGVVAACVLGAFANLAFNKALSLHDASSVVVILEAFLVVVLVGEHIILKEKEQLWIKIASVALAISGAILIQLPS